MHHFRQHSSNSDVNTASKVHFMGSEPKHGKYFKFLEHRKFDLGVILMGSLILVLLITAYDPYLSSNFKKLQLKITLQSSNEMIKNDGIGSTDLGDETRISMLPDNINKTVCDTSNARTDICDIAGDIRIHGRSSTILFHTSDNQDGSWRVKPYPRKRDSTALSQVREVIVRGSLTDQNASSLQCTINHAVPGIVFSIGGYVGNIYHDITDILVPLFSATRRFDGNIQFLVTNRKSYWIYKYKPMLERLTNLPIIDFDNEDRVHCFQQVIVGLPRHGEFDITTEFTAFTRLSLGLPRAIVAGTVGRFWRPKLLIISRLRTRRFLNLPDIVAMANDIGYEVSVMEANGPEFPAIVNSCDVLIGVHGAGMTNLVFLPANATLVQVIPLGKLEDFARYCYGTPATKVGLRYRDYIIGPEESSLAEMYPRDHVVLTNPLAITKKGWNEVKNVYLKQDIRVDVSKLRAVLLNVLKDYAANAV